MYWSESPSSLTATGSYEGKTRAVVKHRPSDAWSRRSGNDHLTNPPGCGKASSGSGASHSAVIYFFYLFFFLLLLENTRGPSRSRWALHSHGNKRDGELNIVCGGNIGVEVYYSLCTVNCVWCCRCVSLSAAHTHLAKQWTIISFTKWYSGLFLVRFT